MSKKKEFDPTYYDTHSFYEDMVEAEKNGTLIVVQEGESFESGVKRLIEAQKRHEARVAAEKVAKGRYFPGPAPQEEPALCVAEPAAAYGG
jgi:hypothetical protein